MAGYRVVAFVAVLAFAPDAFAEAPTPQKGGQDLAVAESLFREGKTAMAQKRYDEACPKFAESHRLDPQTGTLLNLATCHEASGKTASAWGEFNEVIALASRAGQATRVEFAKQHAAAMEAKLSRVKLTSTDPAAASWTVKVDGKVVGAASLGAAIPMDPGSHRVEASAPGKKIREATFDVPQGPSVTEVRVPSPDAVAVSSPPQGAPAPRQRGAGADEAPPPDPATPGGSGSGKRTAGFVLGGIGIASLAVGTVFGLQYLSKADDYNKCTGLCGGSSDTDQDQKSSAQTAGWISTAALGVGIVGLAVGTILVVTAKPSQASERPTSLRVVPALSLQRGGVSLEGRF